MSETGTCSKDNALDYKTIGALLLFLLLVAKAYGVAGFSLTTAVGLITAAPLTVFFGTLALYTYAIMAVICISCLWILIAVIRGNSKYRRSAPLLLVVMIFTGLLTPLPYLVLGVFGAVLAVGISSLLRMPSLTRIYGGLTHSDRPVGRTDVAMVVAGIMLSLFVLLTIRTPWVPAEAVTLSTPVIVNPTVSPPQSVHKPVAFVVNDSNGWVTLLLEDSRRLVLMKDSNITQRRICHLYSQLPGVDPLFVTLQQYTPHDLSCSRLTDDTTERSKVRPSIFTLLDWP
jgi:hypothetical protein